MAESLADDSEMASETALVTDQYDISIQALRPQTKALISALLNPRKIISTDKGLPRDWSGLADLIGIKGEHVSNLMRNPDPTTVILRMWYQRDKNECTILKLFLYLEELDRYDIIDDAKVLIKEDIKVFEPSAKSVEQISTRLECDDLILTRDDLKRIEEGLAPQTYDAFVLFADDDIDFATQLIDKMENQYKLKLCVKDRDLVVGVFEHESVIKLIAERCNRLVAIISPAFLKSSSNKFFCSFAQSIGIEQRHRKIIPCLYSPCQVPPELSCYFMLDYRRAGKLWNFWEKLRDSIQISKPTTSPTPTMYRSTSQRLSPISDTEDDTHFSVQYQRNGLKPKKDCVKFNSMVNLNFPDNSITSVDSNFNPSTSANSLTAIPPMHTNKKSKTKAGQFLKKLLPHKSDKSTNKTNVIEEIPKHHKKSFWTRNFKRKLAVAN